MIVEKNSKTSLAILIGVIVIIWLLSWILVLMYSMKTEINNIRSDAWNAYDNADATYQKLRIVGNDVENILHQMSE